jgi:transposase
VIDEKDKCLLEVKCGNDISLTIKSLAKYKRRLQGVAVESMFNWYLLVDGLMEAGFKTLLVNTAKLVQYNGLSHNNLPILRNIHQTNNSHAK